MAGRRWLKKANIWERTLKIEDFAPILAVEGVDFCSVQYGSALGDELAKFNIDDLATDFFSLQQRIADCDVVSPSAKLPCIEVPAYQWEWIAMC